MQIFAVILSVVLTSFIVFFINYITVKENKKTSRKYDENFFVMRASRKIIYFCAIIGCLLNAAVIIFGGIIVFIEPIVLVVYVSITTIVLYFFDKIIIGGIKYSIVVERNNLTYCGFWRTKKKHFTFADIAYFKRKLTVTQYSVVEVYYGYSKDDKKLFGVTSMLSCYEIFVKVIMDRKFEIRETKSKRKSG